MAAAIFETRNQVQEYLLALVRELNVSLEDPAVAAELDRRDELKRFREKFAVPTVGELLEEGDRDAEVNVSDDCIYLAGNSLGLQPKGSQELVQHEMDKWSRKALYGHMEGKYPWYPIEDFLMEQYSHIVGCKKEEVTAMNSLTANIHFALGAFYRPTEKKFKIIMEDKCFPSDLFAVQSQIRLHGYDPEVALVQIPTREGEMVWRTEDIVRVIEEHASSTALVFLSGIHYATGHLFDMKAITEAAHRVGVCVGFDLAHAAGNVELHLHDWDVDFAVWCSYKYLNSGPGGLGGFYVHERHGNNLDHPRLLGWWSHDRESRLAMPPDLSQVLGARGFHVSNPPILQCMLVKGSLNVFSETSMRQLCQKSRLLTGYLEMLIERNFFQGKTSDPDKFMKIVTSQNLQERGCQLSLQFSWPLKEIHTYLSRRGVVCDLRNPDIMRVAPVPLYNSFSDVFKFFQLLSRAIKQTS